VRFDSNSRVQLKKYGTPHGRKLRPSQKKLGRNLPKSQQPKNLPIRRKSSPTRMVNRRVERRRRRRKKMHLLLLTETRHHGRSLRKLYGLNLRHLRSGTNPPKLLLPRLTNSPKANQ
jgi:hypothetical protein